MTGKSVGSLNAKVTFYYGGYDKKGKEPEE